MTKTLKNSIFFTAILLCSLCNISYASTTSLNNWPDKDKSARIIHNLYLQAQQEINTVQRSTNDKLGRARISYLKFLANSIKNSDDKPEEVFEEIHNRHINQVGISNEEINNYKDLHDRIQEYVNTAG